MFVNDIFVRFFFFVTVSSPPLASLLYCPYNVDGGRGVFPSFYTLGKSYEGLEFSL